MKPANNAHDHEVMYGWALDSDGKPVPIAAAQRGERYFCPVCRGDMVAKLGDVKVHHFAHVTLLQCTPENVARAVAATWITNELQHFLSEGKSVMLQWRSQQDADPHTVNLLKEVMKIELVAGRVSLYDAAGKLRVIIITSLGEDKPDMTQVAQWSQTGTTVILLNTAGVRSGTIELIPLLEQSQIIGGWWLLDQTQLPANLVMEPEKVKQLLIAAAMQPPHYFFGQLESEGVMTHLLQLGEFKLWLPPDYWREIIGGTLNRLGPDIDVLIREWEQADGRKIELFYITVKKNHAVAVRLFAPQDQVRIHVTGQFRLLKFTALDLARQFAGAPVNLPE
jgi:hypothetical protein